MSLCDGHGERRVLGADLPPKGATDDHSPPPLRCHPLDPPRAAQGRRPRARGAVGRHTRARPDAEIGRHAHLRPDDGGHRARPAARPGVLAQPALAADVQPARPLRPRDEPHPRAGRVVGGEQGRPHVDLQAAPGRQVSRRAGADVGGRQVHLRPARREVTGQGRLRHGGQDRAHRQVRDQVRDQGAVRRPPGRPRQLLGLHHQRGGDQAARRPEQGGPRHRPLHARRLEGGAADGPEAPSRATSGKASPTSTSSSCASSPTRAISSPRSAPGRSSTPSSRTTRISTS